MLSCSPSEVGIGNVTAYAGGLFERLVALKPGAVFRRDGLETQTGVADELQRGAVQCDHGAVPLHLDQRQV